MATLANVKNTVKPMLFAAHGGYFKHPLGSYPNSEMIRQIPKAMRLSRTAPERSTALNSQELVPEQDHF